MKPFDRPLSTPRRGAIEKSISSSSSTSMGGPRRGSSPPPPRWRREAAFGRRSGESRYSSTATASSAAAAAAGSDLSFNVRWGRDRVSGRELREREARERELRDHEPPRPIMSSYASLAEDQAAASTPIDSEKRMLRSTSFGSLTEPPPKLPSYASLGDDPPPRGPSPTHSIASSVGSRRRGRSPATSYYGPDRSHSKRRSFPPAKPLMPSLRSTSPARHEHFTERQSFAALAREDQHPPKRTSYASLQDDRKMPSYSSLALDKTLSYNEEKTLDKSPPEEKQIPNSRGDQEPHSSSEAVHPTTFTSSYAALARPHDPKQVVESLREKPEAPPPPPVQMFPPRKRLRTEEATLEEPIPTPARSPVPRRRPPRAPRVDKTPPAAPPPKSTVAWVRYMDALNTLEYMYVKYVMACKDHSELESAIKALEALPTGKEAYEAELCEYVATTESTSENTPAVAQN